MKGTNVRGERQRGKLIDLFLAFGLWALASLLIVGTAGSIGVGYDEPIYGGYALRYLEWLRYLWMCWSSGLFLEPFRAGVIDAYWHAKDMHPPIPKLIAAIGYGILTPLLGNDVAAMRSGTAFLVGAMLAAMYWFGCSNLGRTGALFGALATLFMPRFFGHSHFLTMDAPVAATTVIGTILLVRALEKPHWRPVLSATIGVGLAFASKTNGFLIIPAVFIYIVTRGMGRGTGQDGRVSTTESSPFRPLALVIGIALGATAFLFATWPWLWVAPIERFLQYITFHAKHFPVNTYYLGKGWVYAPWHYPLVMTAVTVPAVTFSLSIIGIGVTLARWRETPPLVRIALISAFIHIAPFLLPTTPKYNGVRLFLPTFPFLSLLAGHAFALFARSLRGWLEVKAKGWVSEPRLIIAAFGLSLLAPAIYGTLQSHPFELSFYNAFVGGVKGASLRWGFETTYWGVNLLNLIPFLNRQPWGIKVLMVPGDLCSYMEFYKNAGVLRKDIQIWGNPKDLPHCDFIAFEAHQAKWEMMSEKWRELLWTLWRDVKPTFAANYGGVPVAAVYDRKTVERTLLRLRLAQGTKGGKGP